MTNIFICTDSSHGGWVVNSTNMSRLLTCNTDKLKLNTLKGNLFLIVGVADKNDTSVVTSHFNSRSTISGTIPQHQTGVVIHVILMQDLFEQATTAEYPEGHNSSVQCVCMVSPRKDLWVQITETYTLGTIAPRGYSEQFLTENGWKEKNNPTNICSGA